MLIRFHVVIPSLPGYFLSTLPRREGWSLKSNARLFNDLMTKALGYKTYVGQGGDWVRNFFKIEIVTPFQRQIIGIIYFAYHGLSLPRYSGVEPF